MTTPTTTPADIQASYGFVGALSRAVPELNTILQQAVREQWTTDRFTMAITDSAWWKANANATRQWLTASVTDPATFENRWNSQAGNALKRAEELGLSLTWSQARDAAMWRSVHEGVDEKNFDGYLARTFFNAASAPGTLAGQAAQVNMQLNEVGSAYGYTMNDNERQDWLRRVMTGETTLDTFKNAAITYASSAYSQYADRFAAGQTLTDVKRPAREALNRILEADVEDKDPLMQRYLHARGDNGQPVDMPVWQLEQLARKDARWDNTTNAKAAVGDMLQTIGRDWGFAK